MKTDKQLKQDVQDELESDPSIDATRVGVEVADRIVTLSGHPPSYAEKLAIERAANRVAGVKALVVDMTVHLLDDDVRTDEDIAKAVRSVLHWTVGVHDDAIKVQVERGWITLSGTVDWAYQSHLAVRAISQMRSVTGVTDHIVVLGTVGADDIGGNIKRAIMRHAEREAKHISIDVHDGTVRLSGKVGSFSERKAVRGAAWSARGVRAVVDDLVVE
ncbi:BON domain-containing protein [Burkholderia vietnamiensis]|jgi:osmotically-inducible protein OsmY|uniref:Transport-associated protein n=2 Tax=Burkholderia vietnamiensis TaxID=60552 RepID=A4JSJ5_BURVG|nr:MULTISPECIES: BON domain-containing protein [Burkholderia]ABO59248.1 transport-associated protein [Burkholderia vietnamiensis G4]TPQ48563.1 BON domain-containing protein [Burkholderia ubonensis]AOJ16930.1 OsmY domain-containing protein [Burkholderia vietnamiensis]AOK02000.1 OsmY domain-containing protein [Burkholderia vietnamiensis]AOK13519.1 OsmY domain-containing protein [Burkholderia vietnamiensis]